MGPIKFSEITTNSKMYNLEKKQNLNISDENKIDSKENLKEDILTISEEAQIALEEKREEMLRELEEQSLMIKNFKEQIEAIENEENPYEIELKCIIIAMRIIGGDEVPQKDKNFLLEHKADMYINAVTFRRQNDNPKKHKSLIKDKEDDHTMNEIQEISLESGSSSLEDKSISMDNSQVKTSSQED